ncbi:putative ubiquitin-conjugating enzyme E2, ribonuclease H-like superfamily [Helianthus annuus]|nr:putative ubiquitin-conjugating enzyme E2, ribonuclease H-like superfamily [Helianthus annuus]
MDPPQRNKGNEVITTDVEGLVDAEGLDEESVVDNTCKAVIDYMLLPYQKSLNPYIMKYRSKFDKFMETYSRVGVFDKEDVLPHPSDKTSQIAAVDDVLDTYKNFKRFEILNGPPDNLFSGSKYGVEEIWPTMARKIHHEWENFEKCLKDSDNIYVRAYKSKMDILTAVIIGNKGTPYHDGLFFIDVIFREHFPIKPPLFRLRSFGYAINPHMFECGEVRLNLSHQWTLPDGQIWVPFVTSLYDLLVNIRDKVLNADPLFLQPGFVECGSSVVSEYFSFLYNENVLIKSLKIMTCIMNKPPKNFEAFVIGHFRNRAKDIMKDCTAFIDGLKAGNGEGNNSCCCSHEFRQDVASCIPELNNSFNKIGATFDDVCSLTPANMTYDAPEASSQLRKDPGWKYNFNKDPHDPNCVTCVFSNFSTKGGIYLAKQHQIGGYRNAKAYTKCPTNARDELKAYVESQKAKKNVIADVFDDLDFVEDEEDNEVIEISNVQKKRSGINIGGGNKKMKSNTKGPIDMHVTRSKGNSTSLRQTSINDACDKELRGRTIQTIAAFFYQAGIAFNVAKLDAFQEMIAAIRNYGPNLKPPSYHELRVPLLKNEVDNVEKWIEEQKVEWSKTGCSIMLDGWTDRRHRTLINFLVNSSKGTVFMESTDASAYMKTVEKVFELLDKFVEQVGESNVVQVITDNGSNFKQAG